MAKEKSGGTYRRLTTSRALHPISLCRVVLTGTPVPGNLHAENRVAIEPGSRPRRRRPRQRWPQLPPWRYETSCRGVRLGARCCLRPFVPSHSTIPKDFRHYPMTRRSKHYAKYPNSGMTAREMNKIPRNSSTCRCGPGMPSRLQPRDRDLRFANCCCVSRVLRDSAGRFC